MARSPVGRLRSGKANLNRALCDLHTIVLQVLPGPSGSGRAAGGTRLVGGSHDHLAVGSKVDPRYIVGFAGTWSRNPPPGTWVKLWFESPVAGCTCSELSIAKDRPRISSFLRRVIAKPRSV